MISGKLIILGQNSNLSRHLSDRFDGCAVVSSSDWDFLESLLKNNDNIKIIYNIFYKSEYFNKIDLPLKYSHYTFGALAQFIDLCLKYQEKIDCVLYTSSCAIYGENRCATESDRHDVKGAHAAVKLASEFFLRDYLKDADIRLIYARVFNMFGGHDRFSVISKIARAMKTGVPVQVNDNGSSIRDFIHVQDVVEIYIKLLQGNSEGVVNVGTGLGSSVASVILEAERIYKRKLNVESINNIEIAHSTANVNYMFEQVGDIRFRSVRQYYLEDYNLHTNGR
jgi:nucleoside-diphosphate-sugar epimerase